VAKFSLYSISLKSLSPAHTFNYELDRTFFEAIDGDEVKKGKVSVEVVVKKNSSTFEFNFKLKGVIQIPCSRCLEDIDQEIDSQNRLVVKLGKEYSEESDEVIIIPEDEGEINVAWFLYEFVALNIPIKHVHPPGKCDKTMSSKLRKHRVSSDDDEDSPGEVEADDDSDDDSSMSDVPDPRWEGLKGLNLEDN
jgi:uncharacterized metal-binding protein YceD (DUF177 family)